MKANVERNEIDTIFGDFPITSSLNGRHCSVCDDLMVDPSPASSCECEICEQGICELCCVRIEDRGGFLQCATCLIEGDYHDVTVRMKFVDKWHEQAFQTMDLNEDVLPKGSQSEGLVQDRFPYNMPFS